MTDFELRTERSAPYAFVGRTRELESLHAYLDLVAKGEVLKDAGIALTDGVQGIGKTSLLRRFLAQAARREDVAIVDVDVETMSRNPFDVVKQLAETADAKGQGLKAVLDRIADFQAMVFGTGVRVAMRDAARSTGTLLRDLTGAWKRTRAVIVAIDEIQTISPDGMSLLLNLHRNVADLPILTVCAGLQNARAVLAEGGMSRPAMRLTLNMLSDGETREAMRKGLRNAGYPGGLSDATVGKLARRTNGFPQHVFCHIAGALLAARDGGDLDDAAVLGQALRFGDERRMQYYEGRWTSLSGSLKGYARSAARWVAERDRMKVEGTRWAFEDFLDETHGKRLARTSISPEEVVDQLVAKGVLTEHGDRLAIAIPSFETYLLEQPGESGQARSEPDGSTASGRAG